MTKKTPPQHGERRCYLRGCRRPECVRADSHYKKRLYAEHSRGERRLHDTTQARAHMDRLFAHGWRQADIARASGIDPAKLSLIVLGQAQTHRRTVLAILSIPIGPAARATDTDATGSRRRLQALATLGHSWLAIKAQTGITEDRLGDIARGLASRIKPLEAQLIAKAYKGLSIKPGPRRQVASCARRKGWHGPLAWDDIDDPAAEPEQAAPYSPPAGNGRDSLRMAELKHLLALGESEAAIAKQMGASEAYIHDLAVAIRNRKKSTGAALAA
ncbi:hypothetical protein [Streptomyces erythrochromogenes]|uniref:hypothetical protein n=1 Tax=Streptomyces erythrochromogenes TaxID=285574 RepID=UPI0037D7A656